jgi:hypothetical protein
MLNFNLPIAVRLQSRLQRYFSFIPRLESDIATSRIATESNYSSANTLVAMKTEGILQLLIPMMFTLPCSAQSTRFYDDDPVKGSFSGYSQPEKDGDLLPVSTDGILLRL